MQKITAVVLVIGVMVGCGKQNEDKPDSPRIKKMTAVASPAMNQSVTLGQSVDFTITSEKGNVDSVQIVVGKEETMFKSGTFKWQPSTRRTGIFSFQVNVFSNGQVEAHYPRLQMLSDVVPEEFTAISMSAYEHDTQAYTQGLFFLNDRLIESTGEKGKSTIRRVHPVTGAVLKNVPLADEYFGEGCTLYKDKIYQLTWTSRVGFIYDLELNQIGTFQFNTDGWGLTTLGDSLVLSDGSEKLYFMNPNGFTEIDRIEVYNHKEKVDNLNELEYVNGFIYANEYQTNNIHIIEPTTGRVMRTIDLSGMLTPAEAEAADVLNGIAYDAVGDRLFVTGKWWPWLFEIKLQPKKPQI